MHRLQVDFSFGMFTKDCVYCSCVAFPSKLHFVGVQSVSLVTIISSHVMLRAL